MELRTRVHNLTFVLPSLAAASICFCLQASAAPSSDLSPNQFNTKTEDQTLITPLPSPRAETWQITPTGYQPAPESLDKIRPTRIKRDQTLNVAAGLWSGKLLESKNNQTAPGITISQTIQNPIESAYEFGLDLTTQDHLGFHWQYKSYCCWGERNEPYWSLGGGTMFNSRNVLVDMLKPGSYQLQAGGGWEDLFNRQRRVRVEGLIGMSTVGLSLVFRLGYAFDDFPSF